MKIIKKIFLSICLFICPLFLTVSCFDPPKNNEWDTVISIQTKFDAFVNSQNQQSKNDFLEALKKTTNKLKNENPKLKSYPDVSFEFKAKGH